MVHGGEKSQARLGLLFVLIYERLEVFLWYSPAKDIVSFALY